MGAINWTNITSAGQLLATPNTNTGGWFWVATNLLLWLVLIGVFSRFGIEAALLAGSFISLVFAFIFAYAGLIAWGWCLFFVGWILFTILYVVYSRKD